MCPNLIGMHACTQASGVDPLDVPSLLPDNLLNSGSLELNNKV